MLPALLSVFAVCADQPVPVAPDDPIALESTEVLSGGEGHLRSSDFTRFQLAPAIDSTDGLEVIPNRWRNFAVEVDGEEVDSWRVDGADDVIAFRVPLGYSGPVAIEVSGEYVQSASFSANRLGLVQAVSYDPDCRYVHSTNGDLSAPYPVSDMAVAGSDAVLLPVRCQLESDVTAGYARLEPQAAHSLTFLPESSESRTTSDEPGLRTWTYVLGSTFRTGEVLLEKAVGPSEAPSLWRARVGTTVDYLEPASCTDLPTAPFAVAELSEGVCLTVDRWGTVRRDGEIIFEIDSSYFLWPPLRFERSSDGKTVLTGFNTRTFYVRLDLLSMSAIPVFAPGGQLLYSLDDYSVVRHAVFSPSGDVLYVLAEIHGNGSVRYVIDRRDAATGELLLRRDYGEFGGNLASNEGVLGARVVDGDIWVAWRDESPERRMDAGLDVIDPVTLEVERSIAVAAAGSIDGWPGQLFPGTRIVPDASGRRATLVTWYGDDALLGYTIDVY